MVCVEGYTLRQIDANTYQCDGGSHTYRIDKGEILIDKFGNTILRSSDETGKVEEEKKVWGKENGRK